MPKSPDAFRTISEVADWLGVQAHVLRFWESKFTQVKPIKRAGGRRYYRPADMLLLGGIKKLLHDDGLTIKGVQKILREQGMSHVADQSQALDDLTMAVIEGDTVQKADVRPDAPPLAESAVAAEPEQPAPIAEDDEPEAATAPVEEAEFEAETAPEPQGDAPALDDDVVEDMPAEDASAAPDEQPQEADESPIEDAVPEETIDDPLPHWPLAAAEPEDAPADLDAATETDVVAEPVSLPEEEPAPVPVDASDVDSDEDDAPEETPEPADAEPLEDPVAAFDAQDADATADMTETDALPSFIRRPLAPEPADMAAQEDSEPIEPPAPADDPAPEEGAQEAVSVPTPKVIDVGPLPVEAEMQAHPAALSALARIKALVPEQQETVKPLLAQLIRLRASMASSRKDARKD